MDSKLIKAEALLQKIDGGEPVIIIDVRDQEKYESGTFTHNGNNAQNIPYVHMISDADNLNQLLEKLPKDAEIVTVCTTGNKAQKAAALLREQGFNSAALEGGLTAWREK